MKFHDDIAKHVINKKGNWAWFRFRVSFVGMDSIKSVDYDFIIYFIIRKE